MIDLDRHLDRHLPDVWMLLGCHDGGVEQGLHVGRKKRHTKLLLGVR